MVIRDVEKHFFNLILLQIPLERLENIILAFCEKLTKAQGSKLGLVCLRA